MNEEQKAHYAYKLDMQNYENKVMIQYDCSREIAMMVIYLRTRSRWTRDLEDRLVRECKAGKKINIMEWP